MPLKTEHRPFSRLTTLDHPRMKSDLILSFCCYFFFLTLDRQRLTKDVDACRQARGGAALRALPRILKHVHKTVPD